MLKYALSLIIAVVVLSPAWAEPLVELRICYDTVATAPYYLGDGTAIDWSKPGLSVEIIKAAADSSGISAQFTRQPWLRCLDNLQEGRVDAIFNASFTTDRLKYGLYPGDGDKPESALRIATLSYSFYRHKGSNVSWDGKELSGQYRPVGVVHGFSINNDLQKMGLPIEESASNDQVFKKLSAGRVPVIAVQTVAGDHMMKSGQYPMAEPIEPPLLVKDYFVMLSRQFAQLHPDLAVKFWQKIAVLRDPMTAQLSAKYSE